MTYLTSEEAEAVRRMAYAGSYSREKADGYVATVERIVRCHRAEALREAAGDVAYGVDWAAAPESVEEWLHDWADQIEKGEQ